MKSTIFIFLCILFFPPAISTAQCDEDIYLLSQDDVNNFNCTNLNGSLFVAGSDITDLSPLNLLTNVVGDVQIVFNPILIDINGLTSLVNVRSRILIGNNDILTQISGLTLFSSVEILEIRDNPMLSTINGFASINSLNFLYLKNNTQLTNLNGLETLNSIEHDLEITSNPELNTLEDYCGLFNLISNGFPNQYTVNSNGYNPIKIEIINQGPCYLLPVELINFHGIAVGQSVHLSWASTNEVNNLKFEVQKSTNGINWEAIHFIGGQSTTNEVQKYKYQDLNPFSGTNYYRLKQVDHDGSFEYSKVITVGYNNSGNSINVFPNPSNRLIKIQINTPSGLHRYTNALTA